MKDNNHLSEARMRRVMIIATAFLAVGMFSHVSGSDEGVDAKKKALIQDLAKFDTPQADAEQQVKAVEGKGKLDTFLKRLSIYHQHAIWEQSYCERYFRFNVKEPIKALGEGAATRPAKGTSPTTRSGADDAVIKALKVLDAAADHDDALKKQLAAYRDPELWEPGQASQFLAENVAAYAARRELLNQHDLKLVRDALPRDANAANGSRPANPAAREKREK
jgi:hypothetical protein